MKNLINWKLFFTLLAMGVISGVMVLPYTLALIPTLAKIITPAILLAQMIQYVILLSISVFFGLRLGSKVGLSIPILEGLVRGEGVREKIKSIVPFSVGWGVAAGASIILLSLLFGQLNESLFRADTGIALWKSFLASFYGGIGEEVLLRFFLMTFFVWISWRIKKTANNEPTPTGVWLAIIAASIIFGLGHLPVTSELTTITSLVVIRAIVLNGVGGMIFGWLYWKKGLESAMIAHFSADIVLHVALPVILNIYA